MTNEENRVSTTTTGPDKKPARRVRVIEIVDDEELEEAPAGETAEEPAAEESAAEEPAKTPLKAKRKVKGLPEAPAGKGGRTNALLAAAVVVLAVVAGLALFQWRSAASAADERKELVARITAFGNVMATYSYDDVESANEKAMAYLTGDALEERKKVDLKALREQLESQQTKLKSTTYAVYVGSIDGNLASAVLVFDLEGESKALSRPQTISKSHLTLGLIKRDGEWMISSMVPAGTEGASAPAGAVPSAAESASPAPSEKD